MRKNGEEKKKKLDKDKVEADFVKNTKSDLEEFWKKNVEETDYILKVKLEKF